MKRLSLLLLPLVLLTLSACNQGGRNKGRLDPGAMISIRPDGTKSAQYHAALEALRSVREAATQAPQVRYSDEDVVRYTTDIWWWNHNYSTTQPIGRGFGEQQRDLEGMRLLMFGSDIITNDGKYMDEFIEGFDYYLTRSEDGVTMDTVAYLPNAVVRLAEKRTKIAFADGDYAECYRLFDEAFRFIPITGAEFLELQKQGKN